MFKPSRPQEAYLAFGSGAHECLGREISIMFGVEMLKLAASMKNLRPAPGDMGQLKRVVVGQQHLYLTEDWSKLTTDATSKFCIFSAGALKLMRYSLEVALRGSWEGCVPKWRNLQPYTE